MGNVSILAKSRHFFDESRHKIKELNEVEHASVAIIEIAKEFAAR